MYVSLMQNFYTEDRWISFECQGESMSMAVNGKRLRVPVRLTVVNGSTMPTSKVARREEAIDLFAKGAIDRRGLHEAMEWPGRAELDQRMDMGPNGVLLERAGEAGLPQEAVSWLQELGALDDKAFAIQKAKKQLPPPPVEPAQNDPAAAERQATTQKLMAEAQKMAAEANQAEASAQKMMAEIQKMQGELQIRMKEVEYRAAEMDLKRGDQETARLAVVAQIKQTEAQARRETREDDKHEHSKMLDFHKMGLEKAKLDDASLQRDMDRTNLSDLEFARLDEDAGEAEADRIHETDMMAQQTALAKTKTKGNSTNGGK